MTPEVSVVLMMSGIVPSLINVYLLYDHWQKPGILWFAISMCVGGVWAFLFTVMTVVPSPAITLFVANFFWTVVPIAAITLFLFAYEFVFRRVVSRRTVAFLFAPVVVFFLLTWFNPDNLIFAEEYGVTNAGFLQFPPLGGSIKALVTKVYGYLLVFLAAGMFVGDAMRSSGLQRKQTIYLLVVFSVLVVSTMVKVVELVPIYFDPTSMMYSFSGLLFAYSIHRNNLLHSIPMAREKAFKEIDEAVVVVDSNGVVVDANRLGQGLFGTRVVGNSVQESLPFALEDGELGQSVQLDVDGEQRYFAVRTSAISYGRGSEGKLVVLSEITELKKRERELDLIKQIFSRVFRHNVRNHLSVINMYTQSIKNKSNGHVSDLAEKVNETSKELSTLSEKAYEIERVSTNDTEIRQSIRDVVGSVTARYEDRSDVVIRSSVQDLMLKLHPKFHLAVRELIENAITHHSSDDLLNISLYTELKDDSLHLVVEDNGPGIPEEEIDVLHAAEETELHHGSGIGLWLVYWIVSHSNGELSAKATDTGTCITIRLPRTIIDEGPKEIL